MTNLTKPFELQINQQISAEKLLNFKFISTTQCLRDVLVLSVFTAAREKVF